MSHQRRFGNAAAMDIHTIQLISTQIDKPFRAKLDPVKSLDEEIEACRRKIRLCVDGGEPNHASVVPPTETSAPATQANPTSAIKARSTSSRPAYEESPKKTNPSKAEIEFRINALKVVELKKELKARGLDANGLKRQLRARLLDAMLEDCESNAKPEMSPLPEEANEDMKTESPKPPKVSEDEPGRQSSNPSGKVCELPENPMDISPIPVMTKSTSSDNDENMADPPIERKNSVVQQQPQPVPPAACTPGQNDRLSADRPKAESQPESVSAKQYWKNLASAERVKPSHPVVVQPVPGSATKLSPLGAAKNASFSAADMPQAPDLTEEENVEENVEPSPEEEAPAPTPSEPATGHKKTGSRVRDLVSKISGSATQNTAPATGSSSALSKTVQAKKDARLARMAEMRVKSKPLAASSKVVLNSKEYATTMTSLNSTIVSTSTHKKNNLAAQMREKTAAAAALRKENVPSNSNTQSVFSSTGKRNLPTTQTGMAPDPLEATVKPAVMKKPKVAPPADTYDTYEISDREDSDTDDSDASDDENHKQKKKIPSWALKANLLPALEQQYNGYLNGRKADPDEIFPEVQTCDLEAIFGGKKSRYTRRTSSGNWTKDKVTAAEKLVYKRTMGFSAKAAEA